MSPSFYYNLKYNQGLRYLETERQGGYSANCEELKAMKGWPCGKLESGEFQSYHGRGASMLSYNVNYAQLSAAIFHGDVRRLLDSPDLVKEQPGPLEVQSFPLLYHKVTAQVGAFLAFVCVFMT